MRIGQVVPGRMFVLGERLPGRARAGARDNQGSSVNFVTAVEGFFPRSQQPMSRWCFETRLGCWTEPERMAGVARFESGCRVRAAEW